MKDMLMLVIEIHLILSFSLIITLFFLGIKNLGFKRFFRELKDKYFWYIVVVFLTTPYQVILIGIGQTGKIIAEVTDKLKDMMKSEAKDE